jgi:hypothetical protein
MPITKERIQAEAAKIEKLIQEDLKNLSREEQVKELVKRGYLGGAISKVLRLSGPQIAAIIKPKDEVDADTLESQPPALPQAAIDKKDMLLISQIDKARLDAKKPILAKQIEAQAWFHSLILNLGLMYYHGRVGRVELTWEDLQNPEKATGKFAEDFQVLVAGEEAGEELAKTRIQRDAYEVAYYLLKDRYERLEGLYRVACHFMGEEGRKKALTYLALKGADVLGSEGLGGGISGG